MVEIQADTRFQFLDFYFTAWQVFNLPDKVHLRGKEKRFIVGSMLLFVNKVDLQSKEYVDQMIELMPLKTADDVYNYRSRLKIKGFLIQSPEGIDLPAGLQVPMIPPHGDFVYRVHCKDPTVLPKKTTGVRNAVEEQERPLGEPKKFPEALKVKPGTPRLPVQKPIEPEKEISDNNPYKVLGDKVKARTVSRETGPYIASHDEMAPVVPKRQRPQVPVEKIRYQPKGLPPMPEDDESQYGRYPAPREPEDGVYGDDPDDLIDNEPSVRKTYEKDDPTLVRPPKPEYFREDNPRSEGRAMEEFYRKNSEKPLIDLDD